MALPQLDRLKSQLLRSGLQQTDNATWQVINQLIDFLRQSNLELQGQISDNTGGDGITDLIGDVVASGPGVATATIQPDAVTTPKIIDDAVTTPKIVNNAVTYGKIQQVTQTSVLLGNGDISAPADVQEIGLGDNLEIESGLLQIVPTGGSGVGLAHKVLSDTHNDSTPSDAVLGDLIRAADGGDLPGTFAGFYALSAVVEDFEGIRFAYVLGFNGNGLQSGNQLWGAAPVLEQIDTPHPDTWLTWNILDFFLQTSIIEDFEGIRFGQIQGTPGGFPYITGNNFAIAASLLEMIPAPDLSNPTFGVTWQRFPIGTAGQIIQPINGEPEWTDDLELAGDAQIDGDVNIDGDLVVQGDLDAVNASVTVTALVALASVSSPLFNGNALGVWASVTFDAANFTANGGTTPTWTLIAADQVTFQYCYIGAGTMLVQVYLATTTVASVAGNVTELRIKIPEARSAVGTSAFLVGAQENGAAVFDIYAGVDAAVDPTLIFIRTFPIGSGRAFDQTANASYFGFTIPIRLNA